MFIYDIHILHCSMHLSGEKAIMALSPHSIELKKKKQHKVNAYAPTARWGGYPYGIRRRTLCQTVSITNLPAPFSFKL